MPYTCTWESRGVHIKFTGVVTLQEVCDSDDAMYEDPRFAQIDYFIWDAGEVTSLALSDTQVDITAVRDMRVSLKKDSLKCAFIAKEQRLVKQLEQYLAKSQGLKICWQMALFNDITRARQWLK
ncbi:hypothetical protein [Thalassomonas actiniarum]|uniref:Uncharacterized protein n=1 Tax=Thalassomonas actiniarum TaxID=485447 RepID=A0AAE9YT91_9GAMM|nr:hypothetical protein [Thalassomonas actiniarum]WDE00805.1 hypothetical protein SG35_009315 [Thalassomonas actiniarum]